MLAFCKALVFRSEHDVKVVHGLVVEVMIVLCIPTHRIALLVDFLPTVVAIVHSFSAWIGRTLIKHLLTGCDVGTSRSVETQVFETMYLIVKVNITHEVLRFGTFVVQMEHGYRVGSSLIVVGQRPCRVVERRAWHCPLVVTAEVFVLILCAVNRLCGVHHHGSADGISFGILGVGIHALEVQVHVQMIVEQTGAQVHRSGIALKV